MNMLIETLGMVSRDPLAWAGVGLMLLLGLVSAWQWVACPHLCGRAVVDPTEARTRIDRPFVAGPGFFLAMLAGIAAILTGLGLISAAVQPVNAFLLVLVGVYIVQTTPIRLRIREAVDRVIVAETEGADAVAIARDRLRSGHLYLVAMNLILAGTVSAGLLAF